MRAVNYCLSRSGCSDLSSGIPDCRNLLYAAIASFLIRPPFIFTADTLFTASFDSSSTWNRMASSKSGPFFMVVSMKLKVRPAGVFDLFFTSFLISVSLLKMTSGGLFQTPRLISRISVFSPTFVHIFLASLYSSCQFPSSWFVLSKQKAVWCRRSVLAESGASWSVTVNCWVLF